MKRKLIPSIQASQSILKTTWSSCWVLIVFTGLAIIGCNNPKSDEKETTDKLEQARQLLNSHDYKSAIKIYSEILATDSTNEELFKKRADLNILLYNEDKAKKHLLKEILNDYNKAILLNPTMRNYIKRAYFNCEFYKNLKAASDDINLGMNAKDVEKAVILGERGYFNFKFLKDSTAAFKDFKLAIKEFPQDSQTYQIYAHCLMESHRWNEAISLLKLYLKFSKRNDLIAIERDLAVCYLKLKDYHTALFLFNNAQLKDDYNYVAGGPRVGGGRNPGPLSLWGFYLEHNYKIFEYQYKFLIGYCKYKLGQVEIGKHEMGKLYNAYLEQIEIEKGNIKSNLPPRLLEIPSEFFDIYPDAPVRKSEYKCWFN